MGVLIIEMFFFRDDVRVLSGDIGRRRLFRGVVTGVFIWVIFLVCLINDFVVEYNFFAVSFSCLYWEFDNIEMFDRFSFLILFLEVVEIKRSAFFCINFVYRYSFFILLFLFVKKKISFF